MTEQKHTKEPASFLENKLDLFERIEKMVLDNIELEKHLKDADLYCEHGKPTSWFCDICTHGELLHKLTAVTKQRDELREALEKIILIREEDCEKYVVKADQIACEALAKRKEDL